MSLKKAASTSIGGNTESTVHTFSAEETEAFCDHINSVLDSDKHIGSLMPINGTNNDLFEKVKDGRLLCKLINTAVADTIDERVINVKDKLNAFQATENHNLCINSAKGIGCTVVNIGPQDLSEGRPHLVLGLVWQIIRIGLLSSINLVSHPELFRLLEPGESIEDLLKLPPDQILLRWLNYHLKNGGSSRRATNFSKDVSDSEIYTIVMSQIAPGKCDRTPLNEGNVEKRAELALQQADKLGCRKFVKPRDIVKGNAKLNLAFVANLFNTCPGLEPLSDAEKAALDEALFKSEGTREARQFALWINSLGIEPFVFNLFNDLRDGLVILRVMDKVEPGCVDWKKVNQSVPLNKFKAVENCNYAVALGKSVKEPPFNFSLVGVGGSDLFDGNQTLTLALVWQLMRHNVLNILKGLSKDGKPIKEDQIISWANNRIAQSGKSGKITSFNDPSLKTSHWFLELLDSIRKCVDWTIVTPGNSTEEGMQNAKYAISIARKLGACIFCLPEDLVEVKPKMILTLAGAIMAVGLSS